MTMTALAPGFTDPPREAQAAFRKILTALSHPGQIVTLASTVEPPSGLSRAAAAAALTLIDLDTPLWLSGSLRTQARDWLVFHCGCPVMAGDRLDCAFALVAAGDDRPDLDTAWLDDPKYPEHSTTLILDCASLDQGDPLILTGPGIRGTAVIAPTGLDLRLWDQRAALSSLYPLGVDIVLTAGDRLVALPRTTRIEREG